MQARYRAYCLHPTLYSAVPTALTPALGGSALATLPRHPRAPARRSALPVHPTPTPGPHDPSSRRSPPARPRGGRCRPGPRPRAALRTHNAVRFPDLSSSLPPTPPPPPLRPPPTHPPTPGPSVTIMKSEPASSSLPSPEEALCHPSAGTNPRWMEYFTTVQFGEDFFFPFFSPPLLSPSPPPFFFKAVAVGFPRLVLKLLKTPIQQTRKVDKKRQALTERTPSTEEMRLGVHLGF